ncbi:DUF6471 domain-containing protein [Caballeronia pedi]|uniref:DUF6471 domain-containing protein n=1 Tax=Caballeronia pedi TaxID=1777141 RepID=UPI001FCA2F72|nr:DUF6471 domain-containing protein [Caballeronia pedi]
MKSNENIDAVWARLVSRATRVALMRQDMSYAELARELTDLGVPESARSVEGKIQRGTFRFSFFLQTVYAAKTDFPERWKDALTSSRTWEEKASAVLEAELALQPWLTSVALATRLDEIGVAVAPGVVESQIREGVFSAALFFQFATVCRLESVLQFVDASSLGHAAMAGGGRT